MTGAPDSHSPTADATLRWRVGQALVEAALDGADENALVVTLATVLTRAGLPLSAVEVACDVVNPERAHRNIGWRYGARRTTGTIGSADVFRDMLRGSAAERRLAGAAAAPARPAGSSDAIAFAGHLAPQITVGFFDDVMVLFATERPDGFGAQEIDIVRDVMPIFALALGARLNAAAARDLLATYLGTDAAEALLDGRVGLGEVASIQAVVLFCDLLGFTTLTETLEAAALIEHLNLFFETVTRPVAQAGGHVAGHVGDAVVMYFPLPVADRNTVCARALGAALAGQDALGALNARLPAGPSVPLRARIGIDAGPVVHGNIGSAGRFSFTIIGSPVNRAARLQALAKELDAAVLLTRELADAAGQSYRSFGRHILRGFEQPVEVVGMGSGD